MTQARDEIFNYLAERIAKRSMDRVFIVAIDGVDGAGKTMFADDLAERLRADGTEVFRAGIDGFHNPRAVRYARGKDSAEGFFRDSFDLDDLKSALLQPFRSGGAFRTRIFDHRTDERIVVRPGWAKPPAILVFDGIFLQQDALKEEWDLTVFLEVPFATSYLRMAAREGTDPDPQALANRRYYDGQMLYFEECRPQERADILIDYSNLERPVLLRS